MPKMKTHRGTAKRFRVTGSGKIMRSKAYKSHIMTKKSQKRKRNFRHETEVSQGRSEDRRARSRPSLEKEQVIEHGSCQACSQRP